MKILMVTREKRPDNYWGADKRYGLNKSLLPLINELQSRGIEVNYLSQAEAGARGIKAAQFLHTVVAKIFSRFFKHTEFSAILGGLIERLNMGRLAARVMAREKYTHVHCHDPFIAAGYRLFARIRWFACFRKCHTARWGLTEHGFGSYSQAFHNDGARLGTSFMRWLRRWEAKILTKAHWVITPTNDGLQQLACDLSIYPIPDNWHAVYHSLPVLNKYSKKQARERLNWSKETCYIIAVGRFSPLKQFSFLVETCAYLKHPAWKLVIIGEGDNTPMLEQARKYGIELQLEFAVADDMGLYYSAADIYVSTSTSESFGLANFEAMIMGLPCICTAVGGVPEVMGSGAWLIPAKQQDALLTALQTLLDNTDHREHWSHQARQRIKNWPDIAFLADTLVAIYEAQAKPQLVTPPVTTSFPPREWHNKVKNWQHCPLPQELILPEAKNILLIAPHPDDETLGCGGTLARLKENNCHIKVIIVTDGNNVREASGKNVSDAVSQRQKETINALQLLGINDIEFFTEPDGFFEHTPAFTKQLETILDTFQPQWIFTPSVLDYHRDHCAIGLSVLSLWQKRNYKERIFVYEIWAPIPATWVVNISTVYEKKQQAIQCYKIPLQYCDYSRGITGLMMFRSLYLRQQTDQYAEAFIELRVASWQSVVSSLYHLRAFQDSVLAG